MAAERRWRDRAAGLVHILDPMYQTEWVNYPPPTRGQYLVSTARAIGYQVRCGYPRRSYCLVNEVQTPATCSLCIGGACG